MEKVYALHRSLSLNRRGVTKARLIQIVGGSETTLFRILRFMRTRLDAPIEADRKTGLFRYRDGLRYELPGIWFRGEELSAFLELAARMEEMQAEILSGHALKPLVEKMEGILESGGISVPRMRDSIRFLPMRSRKVEGAVFNALMQALFRRRRIRIRHEDGASGSTTERVVTHLKIVRYRDNWYLDAFCHLREDYRIFALSGIQSIELTDAAAHKVPEAEAKEYFASAYGIFGGKAKAQAVIQFKGAAARFISRECWHPQEERSRLPDGSVILRIPFGDTRELLGDILRYGDDAEILEPQELRQALSEKLKGLNRIYGLA